MTFNQFSSSHDGRYDIDASRRFWDAALQRLKVHVELGELEAMLSSSTDLDPTRAVDSEGTQSGESGRLANWNNRNKDR